MESIFVWGRSFKFKSVGYLGAFAAATLMAFATGCASGGFHLTRQYAGFVNKQPIILRIIIYIFTSVVFAITLLIDMVFFNTIDFWEGRVSAGSYDFKKDDKVFHVRHEFMPGNLKHSTIVIKNLEGKLLQEVVLSETNAGEIELLVDGKLRTRVRDIKTIPMASIYDASGKLTDDQMLPVFASVASVSSL